MSIKAKKDSEADTERGLFGKVVEAVIVFVICCYLVKLGVSYLTAVRKPLLIIAGIGVCAVIRYRIRKWRNHHDDY